MKTNKEKVIHAMFAAVDDVNKLLPEERRLQKSPDIVLYGTSGQLDSLAFVNFILAVEHRIQEEFGCELTLTDGDAMSQKNGPMGTIATLADYISLLLEKKFNG